MRKILTILLLSVLAVGMYAVPAKPGLKKMLTLADGSTIEAQLVGDEWGNYWRTDDGRAFVFDKRAGGQEIYRLADANLIQREAKKLRDQANSQRTRRAPIQKVGSFTELSGTKRCLIILVNFQNATFSGSDPNGTFQKIANQPNFVEGNFKGSMADYFRAQSNNIFNLEFDVVGPVTVENDWEYYGENVSSSSNSDKYAARMVQEAMILADEYVDYSDYDWDGDGSVDQVYVVYAGKGAADGGDALTIWPHAWDLMSAYYYGRCEEGDYNGALYRDDVWLSRYACGGELNGQTGETAGIGTMCHEFSHCLGYPDFYDTDYSGGPGMGYWDLMDQGSYNDNGYQPAGYTGYERWVVGWSEPIELKYRQQVTGMGALQEYGDYYIMYNPANNNEYYMLENRQKVGWDSSLYGSGLLIIHVDYDAGVWAANGPNDDPNHQRFVYVPADNSHVRRYYSDLQGDLWPWGTNNSFSKNSTPAASLYNQNTDDTYYLNYEVNDITQNADGTISFNFVGPDNLVLTFSQDVVNATMGEDFTTPTLSSTPAEAIDVITITYSSSDETVATVDATTGAVTLTGSGTTVITATFTGNDDYSYTEAQYTLNVALWDDGDNYRYVLVTDADELTEGDKIVIVHNLYKQALGVTQNNNNRSGVAFEFEADGSIKPDMSQVAIIELGKGTYGTTEGWTMRVLNGEKRGYLTSASSTSNSLKTRDDVVAAALADISIADNSATIDFKGSYNRKRVRYDPNNNNPIFACYPKSSNTGYLPQIYRRTEVVNVDVTALKYASVYYSDKSLKVPADLEARTYKVEGGTLSISHTYAAGEVIPAGTAVVLYGDAGHYLVEVTAKEGTADTDNLLLGKDEDGMTTADGDVYFYMLTTKNGENPGFYWGADQGAAFLTRAHKAYLAVDKTTAASANAFIFDTATGINTVNSENGSEQTVYDLQGRRVTGFNLPKGVYIVNGKKTVIK